MVILATGERINAIVIEISEDYVHYKKCGYLRGKLYTVKTKNLDNITFRNGEYFIPQDRTIVDKEKERKKSKTAFVMPIIAMSFGLLCVILSFFIHPAGLIVLILNVLNFLFTFSVMMFNIRPTKYVPSYRTKFTWIFALLAFLLIIISIVLISIAI